MPDLVGKTIGKYRIVARLGRGGMAEVYKAYQPGLDRYVALKVLHSYLADDADFIGRFEREARAVANLRHPNIVQVFDFDVQDDMYYMAMEFVDGPTLKAELQERSRKGQNFSVMESARIMVALCDAIDYAHRHGMVHRDLKPANFILNKDGQVLVLDFGIAKIVGATQYTVTGAVAGTPAYMSPEQGQGQRGDARSDIYSLGVVLYEMVTGRVPFDADTPFAVIMKHISDPLPMPRSINPDLPEAVETVILKALAKNPDDRFQSALDFSNALRDAVGLSVQDTLIRNPVHTIAPVPKVKELSPDDDAFTPFPTVAAKPPSADPPDRTVLSGGAGGTPPTGTLLATPKGGGLPSWLLIGGGVMVLVLLVVIVGLLLLNNQRGREIDTQATSVAKNRVVLEQTATAQAIAGVLPSSTAPETTDTLTPTLPPTYTPVPSSTPNLEATIAARLAATADGIAAATATAITAATADAPTDTPTPLPTDTPTVTNTPKPLPPTATPKPLPPTATPTATPPPVPKFQGHLAVPIDNGFGRYDVHIFDVTTGTEIGEIIGARQPYYRADGQLLVNGDTSPTGEGAGDNVYIYNVDGTGGRQASGSPEDEYATWSPDGTRIAYDNRGLVHLKNNQNEWHLFVQDGLVPPDINHLASFNVILGDIFDAGQPLHPVWAADDYLIFRACDIWPGGRGGANCAIWRVPSWATETGGVGYQVPVKVASLNGVPTDTLGNSLLVMSRESGNWDVYLTGIAGGGVTNLTDNPAQDGLGAFSPDGQWVAFVSDRDGGWAVWVVSVNGGEAQKLLTLPPPPWGAGEHDWTLERISWGP